MENWYRVGKIVNTHGIQGEVRVVSTTDFADQRFAKGNKLAIFKDGGKEIIPVTIKTHREHKNFNLISFVEFPTINDVEKFKGSELRITSEQLHELETDEFYYHEIIGCKVVTTDGRELGIIKEILSPGANDVWVIKAPKGKELLIPYIEDVVKEVNIKDKLVMIEVIEGLID